MTVAQSNPYQLTRLIAYGIAFSLQKVRKINFCAENNSLYVIENS